MLVANEVINFLRRLKRSDYLFKLDFHKAFDSVIWDYLDAAIIIWDLEIDGEVGLCSVLPQH